MSSAPFTFVGKIPASKSILNRARIVQSFAPDLQIYGDSLCEDVELMKTAVAQLHANQPFQVGSAGTVLRFLALRLGRIPGCHVLSGSPRLFERPQEELMRILGQLGVRAELNLSTSSLVIEGDGWKLHGDTLLVPGERSSQFASAVLLSAWDLPFDLYVSRGTQRVSEGYWRMSVAVAESLGMKIDFWDADFRVPKRQTPARSVPFQAETDMSSAFSVAAVAAVSGQATLLEFPSSSSQPDFQFKDILQKMGAKVSFQKGNLRVEKNGALNGVAVNLNSSPDLFPVLAALCALAEGESDLFGAPHLVYKESNRLARMAEWIEALGRKVEVKSDGMRIVGSKLSAQATAVALDCAHDHRLAFAASVLRAAGLNVKILNPESVLKSFPEFWDIVGWPE